MQRHWLTTTLLVIALGLTLGLVAVAQNVTLKMAMWGSPDEEAVYNQIIQAFEQANPNIKVDLSVQPWGAYWTKLETQIVGGIAPDVFAVNGGWLQVFASKGVLKGITSYVANNPSITSELFPQAVNTFKYQGKLFGLPRDFNTYVVFYNKTMFDKSGVPYPKDGWTWQDYLKTAQALTKDLNGDGRIDQWGCIVDTRPDVWMAFVWQNGGNILDSTKTKSVINSPATIGAFQYLADLVLKYHVSPTYAEQEAFGWNPFGTGKIGMYITGRWMVPTYKQAKFDWDVQVLPRGKKMVAMANSVGFGVYKNSKHPDAAFKLLSFISTNGQKYLLKLGSSVPCSKSAAYSSDFLDFTPPANEVAFLNEIPYSRIMPFVPQWNELWDIWTKYPELIMTGKLSPTEGVQKMDADMQKVLSSK